LFNVFIEKAINVIKLWLEQKGIGVKIGGVLITMLRFADDIVVLATSEEDLQAALNVMNLTFKEYSLKVNRYSQAQNLSMLQEKRTIYKYNISKQRNYPSRPFQILRQHYNRRREIN